MSIKYCPITKTPIFDMPSVFLVNTNCFQPGDLDLFVDSMEILTRFEKKRYQQRKRKVSKKSKPKSKQKIETIKSEIDNIKIETIAEVHEYKPKSPLIPQIVTDRCQSIEDGMDEPVTHLEVKKLRKSDTDETYYSGQESSDNSPRNSVTYREAKLKFLSDSEESGVFAVGEQYYFDNALPIRPRSEVISKLNRVSPRSQLIDEAIKRQCLLSRTPSITDSDISDDIKLAVERCDRALAEVMNQKYDHLTENKRKGKYRQGFALKADSPEEEFLDRALSLLKL